MHAPTKIKICGMTQPDNVAQAIDLGVDAIGMILHAASPRLIDADQALAIRRVVPKSVMLVGVFVNCDVDRINALTEEVGLDLIQLHGDEEEQQGLSLIRPYIKAIRAKSASQVAHQIESYSSAYALLLDPYVAGQYGGTGRSLDFKLWPRHVDKKLILAGGLGPENVSAAVSHLKPYAVDLNSGLEKSPGVKDPVLMKKAIANVCNASSKSM